MSQPFWEESTPLVLEKAELKSVPIPEPQNKTTSDYDVDVDIAIMSEDFDRVLNCENKYKNGRLQHL